MNILFKNLNELMLVVCKGFDDDDDDQFHPFPAPL